MNFANLKSLSAFVLGLGLAVGAGNIGCSSSDSGGGKGGSSAGGSGEGGSSEAGSSGSKTGGASGSKTGGTSGSKTGGAGGSSSSTGTPVTLDTFPQDTADASCKVIVECCPVAMVMGAPKDLAICTAQRKAIGNFSVKAWRPSVDAKYLEFDGAKARACFDAQAALKCGAKESDFEALPCKYITPKVALDGTCLITTDCIEGWCDGPKDGPKKCVAKKADGATCMGGEECTSGNCKSANGAKTCAAADAPRDIPAICEYFL